VVPKQTVQLRLLAAKRTRAWLRPAARGSGGRRDSARRERDKAVAHSTSSAGDDPSSNTLRTTLHTLPTHITSGLCPSSPLPHGLSTVVPDITSEPLVRYLTIRQMRSVSRAEGDGVRRAGEPQAGATGAWACGRRVAPPTKER